MGKTKVFTNLPNHYEVCIECTMQMRGIYSHTIRERCHECGGTSKLSRPQRKQKDTPHGWITAKGS